LPSIEAYFLSNQELNISCQKKQWKESLTRLESTEKKKKTDPSNDFLNKKFPYQYFQKSM
jgi:hypothetical protein